MAGNAARYLGVVNRHLAKANVVERLDALAPGLDLRLVDVWSGGGVVEGQAPVHVLRRRGILLLLRFGKPTAFSTKAAACAYDHCILRRSEDIGSPFYSPLRRAF